MQCYLRCAAARLNTLPKVCSPLPQKSLTHAKCILSVKAVQPQIWGGLATSTKTWFTMEKRKEYTLDINDMKKLSENDKITLIDVREPAEVSGGKVPAKNYIHVPIGVFYPSMKGPEEDFEKKFGVKRPSKNQEIVFMCKGGIRSTFALQVAQHMGFTNSKHYPGGWIEWEKSLD